MAASQSWLQAQRVAASGKGGFGGGYGKGKGSYQRRVAEIKADPNWTKAVSNIQHLGTWAQLMYPKVEDCTSSFTRPLYPGGPPVDSAPLQEFLTHLSGDYCEEFNKSPYGWSESAS